MQLKHVESRTIRGLSIRTSNGTESNPETAQIMGVWQRLWGSGLLGPEQTDDICGVYHDYESDASGEYSLLVGSGVIAAGEGISEVTLEAGDYMVFAAQGAMPQIVMETWGRVWQHFADPASEYQRTFTTDFERYPSPSEVEIHIAVKRSSD